MDSAVEATTVASAFSTEQREQLIIRFWVYVIEGAMLAVLNYLIVLAILRHPVLRNRKEYIILSGLAFADGSNGLATVIGGFGRNMMLITGEGATLISRWECLLKVWNLLWLWVEPLCAIMLMVVNLDRLLLVLVPIRHIKFGVRYATWMVGAAYGWVALSSVVAVFLSHQHQKPEFPEICFNEWSLDDGYYTYMTMLSISMGLGSILVYAATAFIYVVYRRSKGLAGRRNEKERAQRRLTVTMGISSVFTLLLYVLPNMLELYLTFGSANNASTAGILAYTFIIKNLNQLMNFFIYTARHHDIRFGIWYMLRCRRLTNAKLNAVVPMRITTGVRGTTTKVAARAETAF